MPDRNREGLQHFYLAECQTHRILTWELAADGTLSNGRVLIKFPKNPQAEKIARKFGPDGMAFDAAGRLYVAMYNGSHVNVIDARTGTLVRQYQAGGTRATNCHFHGGYLYVTIASKEAVFRLNLGVKGFQYSAQPAGEPTAGEGLP